MPTKREKIIKKSVEILLEEQNGIRYSELVKKLKNNFPDIPVNTIHGSIWNLDTRVPNKVYKAARGLFRHTSFKEEDITGEDKVIAEKQKISEEDFYGPFADWLVKEMEECTKAIALGGNKFRDKWGTPDVIGIRESRRSDIIKFPPEIISAEIKTDSSGLITAFGQACSYKLFSHRCYIVIPQDSSEDDKTRLDSLCMIFGIGLVLFDSSDTYSPQFTIRSRPLKHEPDSFFVNKYLKLIERELF